jgi:hypothetical protein
LKKKGSNWQLLKVQKQGQERKRVEKRHILLKRRKATTSKLKKRVEITKFGLSFRQNIMLL